MDEKMFFYNIIDKRNSDVLFMNFTFRRKNFVTEYIKR